MKFKNIKLLFLTSVSLLGIFIVALGGVTTSNAFGFCGRIGSSGLSPDQLSTNLRNLQVEPNLGNRKYTIEELFPVMASSYSVPVGEGEGHWFLTEKNHIVSEKVGNLTEDQKKRLESQYSTCWFNDWGIQSWFQNISKQLAAFVTGFINWGLTSFFDQDFICDGSSTKGTCIPLLEIIGGKQGGNGGILGIFSRGIFLPLASVAFLFTAGWLIYNGMIKMQFRSSFGGLIWAVFAFFLGIVVLVRPTLVARAPHSVNMAISNCLLQSISGGNCLGNGNSNGELFTAAPCVSESRSTADMNQQMQLSLNGLTCTVLKGLTVDRWAEQQFGYSFDELYTVAPANEASLSPYPANKLQGSPTDYCVNLYSNKSPKQIVTSGNLSFSSQSKVCNIALAYMANRVDGNFGTTAQMEHIVATAAKDPTMWSAFTGGNRDIFGFTPLISTIAAAISFIPVVIYGHAYSLTATILITFAPIFLLFAIHPGRGRKIFLGWLEAVISSCLKFMATGMLILVMILMYSGILGQVKNGILVLLMTVILAFTFTSYRKELVNLIGVANLGGASVSNKMEEALNKGRDKVGDAASAVVGGAVGGAIVASQEARKSGKNVGAETLRGALQGTKKSIGMNLSRGTGVVANATRQYRSVGESMRRDREKYQEKVAQELDRQQARETFENMGNKVLRQQEKLTNLDTQNQYISEINNAKTDTPIPKLDAQLDNAAQNVSNQKHRNEIHTAGKHALELAAETKSISTFVKNDPTDGNLAKDNYIKYESINAKGTIEDNVETIKANEMFKSMVPEDQERVLNDFVTKSNLLLDNHKENLNSNFKIIETDEGSAIDNVNLEKNISDKKEYKINQEQLLKDTIDNLRPIPPSRDNGPKLPNIPPVEVPTEPIIKSQSGTIQKQEPQQIIEVVRGDRRSKLPEIEEQPVKIVEQTKEVMSPLKPEFYTSERHQIINPKEIKPTGPQLPELSEIPTIKPRKVEIDSIDNELEDLKQSTQHIKLSTEKLSEDAGEIKTKIEQNGNNTTLDLNRERLERKKRDLFNDGDPKGQMFDE